MYQPLIWAAVLRDDARCLRSPLDAEDCKRLPDPLVDRVGRNSELGRDFLGAEMLVDEAEAIELPVSQTCNAISHRIIRFMS
jgi:hypothetical protein